MQINKILDELVFAIPTNDLWDLINFKEKSLINSDIAVLERVVQKGVFCERSELEEDPSYKQIIPYSLVSFNDSFYLFKRTSKQKEKRLHDKFSLGVGGHMNPGKSQNTGYQYLTEELKRELFEEINLINTCKIENIEFVGFINDDTIPVGKVHIGLLYNIHLSNKEVGINETDKMTAEWIEKKDLYRYYNRMETWSMIIFDYYIKQNKNR